MKGAPFSTLRPCDYLRTASGDGRLASQAEIFWISAVDNCATMAPITAFLRVFAVAGAPAAPRL